MAIETRSPTSDEAVVGAWSGTAGSRWALVNDYPDTADGTTSPVAASASISFNFSAFSIPSDATNIVVRLNYYDRRTSGGTSVAGGRLKVGGNYYTAATHNPGSSATLRTDTWSINPKTGVAWTVDDINGVGTNALQAFGLDVPDSSPQVLLYSIQAEVEYTEGTPQVSDTDTAVITAGEAEQVSVLVPDADAVAVTLGEAEDIAPDLAEADAASVAVSEAEEILIFLADADQAAVAASEADNSFLSSVDADAISVVLQELEVAIASLAEADVAAVGLGEAEQLSVFATLTEADLIAVVVQETESIFASVFVANADFAAVTLLEAEDIVSSLLEKADADAIAVLLGEAEDINVPIANSDVMAVSLLESEVVVPLAAGPTTGIALPPPIRIVVL